MSINCPTSQISKKENLIFILAFFIGQLNCQTLSIFRAQLQNQDYSKFCEVYNNKKELIRNVSFGETWGLKRQVSNSFYEETKYFSIETPIKNNPSSYNLDVYKICMLSNNDKIAIYKFQEKRYKIIDSLNTEIYYQTLDSMFQNELIEKFRSEFKMIFNIEPDFNDLFEQEYVFGNLCGFDFNKTKGQNEIDSFLKSNNNKSILSYLKAMNTEKQLFGVEGVRELQKRGYKPSAEELKIINFIIHKKGEIEYCSGCIFENANIQRIMN